jgi:hypothetical protein
MSSPLPPKFSFTILKHRGDLDHAETVEGKKVHRQEKIWFYDHGWVRCAPYDNHFIYDDPMAGKIIGRWTPMCTCGSPAVIVGYNVYKDQASPSTKKESTVPGEMLVCFNHAQFGKHSDGSS